MRVAERVREGREELVLAAIGVRERRLRSVDIGQIGRGSHSAGDAAERIETRIGIRLEPSPLSIGAAHACAHIEGRYIAYRGLERAHIGLDIVEMYRRDPIKIRRQVVRGAKEIEEG